MSFPLNSFNRAIVSSRLNRVTGALIRLMVSSKPESSLRMFRSVFSRALKTLLFEIRVAFERTAILTPCVIPVSQFNRIVNNGRKFRMQGRLSVTGKSQGIQRSTKLVIVLQPFFQFIPDLFARWHTGNRRTVQGQVRIRNRCN